MNSTFGFVITAIHVFTKNSEISKIAPINVQIRTVYTGFSPLVNNLNRVNTLSSSNCPSFTSTSCNTTLLITDTLARWLLKPGEEDEGIIEIEEGEEEIDPGMPLSDMTALNNNSFNCASINPSHLEQQSITKSYLITRIDKFDSSEIKDLLKCLIFVLKNLNDDALLSVWYNYDDGEFSAFLTLLDLCLNTFKYRGKSNIHKHE
ncbi:hypothetical protein BpHYR1_017683 [Brachionus plicatilis]|uniref:Uncharacterized protein n=1 Tax=Brachionus plicatilis TaxID=10195 RepID=A0A3M7RT19_BRAPC|nr:hypothetical protein BpHYR1_017683 [Brachionus plicatilis]